MHVGSNVLSCVCLWIISQDCAFSTGSCVFSEPVVSVFVYLWILALLHKCVCLDVNVKLFWLLKINCFGYWSFVGFKTSPPNLLLGMVFSYSSSSEFPYQCYN